MIRARTSDHVHPRAKKLAVICWKIHLLQKYKTYTIRSNIYACTQAKIRLNSRSIERKRESETLKTY